MNIAQIKELLTADGIEFAPRATAPQLQALIVTNYGSLEDGMRSYNELNGGILEPIIVSDEQIEDIEVDSMEAFRKAREGNAQGKIENKAGERGLNPMRFAEVQRLGEVVSCELTTTKKGKETYKLQVRVIGASQGYCYSDREFQLDDLVIVNCRILKAGIYKDEGADKVQRELHVPAGRKMAYAINNPKFASKQRIELMEVAKAAKLVEL
jgi:hypothetical protein